MMKGKVKILRFCSDHIKTISGALFKLINTKRTEKIRVPISSPIVHNIIITKSKTVDKIKKKLS